MHITNDQYFNNSPDRTNSKTFIDKHSQEFIYESTYLYPFMYISDHHSHFFKLGFTPCKAKPLLQGMELQEEEAQKD